MGKEDKTNTYLLALVGIVGFVAVVVLIMNAAGSSSDLAGEAYSAKKVTVGSSGLKDWNNEDCYECPNNPGEWVCGDAKCSTKPSVTQ